MAPKDKRAKGQNIHRASVNMHDFYGALGDMEGFEESFEPDLGPAPVSAPASTPASGFASASAPAEFARFQLLYESRDGKMAVFEDEHGHIVAVDAKRLA